MVQVTLICRDPKTNEVVKLATYPDTLEFPELKSIDELTFDMVRNLLVEMCVSGTIRFRGGYKIEWIAIDDCPSDKPHN